MNKARRKEIEGLAEKLEWLAQEVEDLAIAEGTALEHIRDPQKREESEMAEEQLRTAMDTVEDAVSALYLICG